MLPRGRAGGIVYSRIATWFALLHFLVNDFVPMNAMGERAGMFERLNYDRSKRVFEYLGLPCDAPPSA